jgi:hypothetical protein
VFFFGFGSFSSCFLYEVLDEEVQHASALLRLGDVKVAFGVLFGVSFKGFPFCFVISPLFQVFETSLPLLI